MYDNQAAKFNTWCDKFWGLLTSRNGNWEKLLGYRELWVTIKSQKEFINIHDDANCTSITEQSDTFAQLNQKPQKFALNDSKAREVFVKEECEFPRASQDFLIVQDRHR